jgi:hypothetical protein
MRDPSALRAEAKRLFELAGGIADAKVVEQIRALAAELERLASEAENGSSAAG